MTHSNLPPQPSGFSKLFIEKTFATLLLITLVLGGVLAFNTMLRENNPDLDIPQALITVEWPGAAPEQIEKEVTKPMEDALNGLKGLKKLDSSSQYSFALIAVEFESHIPSSSAIQDLRGKVDEAKAEFPSGVKSPKIEQVSVNDTPVIEYMLYGSEDQYAYSVLAKKLKKRIENHSGVRKVELGGYREENIHIRLLPDQLATLGISPTLVKQRIEEANLDMSWGEFESDRFVAQLYYSGRFSNLEQLKQLPIKRFSNDRVVQLQEIAQVYRGLDKLTTETHFSVEQTEYSQGVSIGIKKRPGVDTLALIADLKVMMQEFTQADFWPRNIKASIISDESEVIEQSFNSVFDNIWQAMLAVFIVLMLLLSWREAVIAGLAIPVTFMAVLLTLNMLGYTLNQMVIIGMVLALGLLVDVFILVMEGMHDHLHQKKLSFIESAIGTAKTYALPAFSGQLTTILAMTPMLAIGGIDGKFIRLIPVTATLSLIFSYIIAFVICIPLSQLLLKANVTSKPSVIGQLMAGISATLQSWLQQRALKTRRQASIWVMIAAGAFVVSLVLVSSLPSQLYPKGDGRNIAISITLPPNATLNQSREVAKLAGAYLREQAIFDSVTMYIGEKSPHASSSLKEQLSLRKNANFVGFTGRLPPKSTRDLMGFEFIPELRAGLDNVLHDVAGLDLVFKVGVGGSSSEDPLQIVLRGSDVDSLYDYAAQTRLLLQKIPGVTDIRFSLDPRRTQIRIGADAEALSFHEISESDFAAQLRLAVEADEYGKFKLPGIEDDLKIRLSTYWESRANQIGGPRSVAEISNINIMSPAGESIPLANLADYEVMQQPPSLQHNKTQRAITVSAKLDGTTVDQVIAALNPQLSVQANQWPSEYSFYYSGEAENAADTYGSAGIVFGLAIFLVFAVLTLVFNSFKQPVIVLTTIPLALIGTFSGFWLFSIPFSFPAMIGLIALVGIVVNNAIVIVDTINVKLAAGKGLLEAISEGAADRLRPIVGTTITTIVGLLPLALNDPMWFPLCMAIIFGLLSSTVVAMVVIPSLFLLLSSQEFEDSVNSCATNEAAALKQ